MSVAVIEKELIDLLLANLPTGFTSARVEVPNGSFNKPEDQAWLRATVLIGSTTNTTATGSASRTTGRFIVDVFHPLGAGAREALEAADFVRDAFHNQKTEHAELFETTVRPLGIEPDTQRYHVQAETLFYYHNTEG